MGDADGGGGLVRRHHPAPEVRRGETYRTWVYPSLTRSAGGSYTRTFCCEDTKTRDGDGGRIGGRARASLSISMTGGQWPILDVDGRRTTEPVEREARVLVCLCWPLECRVDGKDEMGGRM